MALDNEVEALRARNAELQAELAATRDALRRVTRPAGTPCPAR